MRPARAFAAVVAAAAAAVAAPVAAASAHVPQAGPAQAKAAFEELDALARGTRAARAMPRLSDPAAAASLRRLFDAPAVLGASPYTADDVPALLDVGDLARAVAKSYVLFAPDGQTLPDTAANSGAFQDEIALSMSFMVAESAATFDAFADFVAHLQPADLTQVRRDGLRQAQAGVVEFMAGVNVMLADPNLREPNRIEIADALAAHGAALARGLSLADRAAVAAATTAAMQRVGGPAEQRLARFVAAMRSAACTGLCGVR